MLRIIFPPFPRSVWMILAMLGAFLCCWTGLQIFVTTYIYQRLQDPAAVFRFYFAMQCGFGIGCWIAGPPLKAGYSRALVRIALAAQVLFFAALLGIDDLGLYLLPLGFSLGVGSGLFWPPYNILTSHGCPPELFPRYFAVHNAVAKLASIAVPPLCGLLIWYFHGNYSATFLLLIGAALGGCLATAGLAVPPPEGAYRLRSAWNVIRSEPELRQLFWAFVFIGLSYAGAMMILLPLLVFKAVGNELRLGFVIALFPAIEIVISYIVAHTDQRRHRSALLISAAAIALAGPWLVWQMDSSRILLFAVLYALVFPLHLIIFCVYSFRVFDYYPKLVPLRAEYIVLREWALIAGRLISYVGIVAAYSYWTLVEATGPAFVVFGAALVASAVLLGQAGAKLSGGHR